MKIMKSKRGSISIYLTFAFISIFIILIGAVLAPMGVQINAEFYRVGEEILLDSNSSIAAIQDDDVRAQIQSTLNSALDSTQNNIEVNAAMFQYSWVGVVALAALIVFLATRRTVEIRQQTGGIV